ncbi:hypothetical protein [Muricoccus pecuniae]|uniref:Uncharacterized protein n=1 Tax=Muricoccus pecuniae TaxID=693023 RepID=A0A840XZV9_9PROT|nr:hypothetical protein [Roseomonas pecuniae]MBB5694388.1 hypothetical protein [Roseomonas pecuniae]
MTVTVLIDTYIRTRVRFHLLAARKGRRPPRRWSSDHCPLVSAGNLSAAFLFAAAMRPFRTAATGSRKLRSDVEAEPERISASF